MNYSIISKNTLFLFFSILFTSCQSDEFTPLSLQKFDNFTVVPTQIKGDGTVISGNGLTYYINDKTLEFKLLLKENKEKFDGTHYVSFSLSEGIGNVNGISTNELIPLNEGTTNFIFNLTTDPGDVFFIFLEIKNEYGIKKLISIPVTTTF